MTKDVCGIDKTECSVEMIGLLCECACPACPAWFSGRVVLSAAQSDDKVPGLVYSNVFLGWLVLWLLCAWCLNQRIPGEIRA